MNKNMKNGLGMEKKESDLRKSTVLFSLFIREHKKLNDSLKKVCTFQMSETEEWHTGFE